jgi:hypothetical protein
MSRKVEVGDVLEAEGLPPLRVCGVLNGRYVVTPVDEFGPSELVDAETLTSYGVSAEPPRENTEREQMSLADKVRTDEGIRDWAAAHPETARARRLEAKYGSGPREGSPEHFFAQQAERDEA